VAAKAEVSFRLHSGGQSEFVRDRTRFKVAACGRRWGKTVGGVADVVGYLLERGAPARALWVAPTYSQADEAVRIVFDGLGGTWAEPAYNRSTRVMEFVGGGMLFFRSGEIPRNLRGRGWDLVVVDEAAFIPDDVWLQVLRPALADRGGRAVMLSTPCGAHGWFWEEYQKGIDSGNGEVKAWQFPTWDNPAIPASEIEQMRASLPERVFRQEVAAEFLAGEGAVFSHLALTDDPVPVPLDEAKGGVVVGCDLAKIVDYTVAVALDAGGRVLDMLRMNQVDYSVQVVRVAEFARRYQAAVYLDATGVGVPVLEQFHVQRPPLSIVPVKFTNDSKRQMVQNLQLMLEREDVKIPRALDVLVQELQVYSAVATASGPKYGAPRGLHDDCVTALMLAAWGQSVYANPPVHESIGGSFL